MPAGAYVAPGGAQMSLAARPTACPPAAGCAVGYFISPLTGLKKLLLNTLVW